jgi:uncharacterized protein
MHTGELPAPVGPSAAAERAPLLDVLRGVAILGVLVAYTVWNLGTPPRHVWNHIDPALDLATEIVVDGKFLTLFAFLFGVGSAQQWRRVEMLGPPAGPTYARRMLFLLAAGLIHGTLLRNGDILAPYAMLGMLLLMTRHWSTRALLVTAVVLAILPYGIQALFHAAGWTAPGRPGDSASNLDWFVYWYKINPLFGFPRILAIMVCGVLADRHGVVRRVATDRRFARRILLIALPVAVVSRAALFALPVVWSAASGGIVRGMVLNQLHHLEAWSLAPAYACGLALLLHNPVWVERLQWLRSTGRMAFTNYLVQALVIVPACLLFGLFDTVTPTRGWLLALAVMAVQIPFSVWWLRRFEYGPLEWVWRAFTYGRVSVRVTSSAARHPGIPHQSEPRDSSLEMP